MVCAGQGRPHSATLTGIIGKTICVFEQNFFFKKTKKKNFYVLFYTYIGNWLVGLGLVFLLGQWLSKTSAVAGLTGNSHGFKYLFSKIYMMLCLKNKTVQVCGLVLLQAKV